MEANQRTVSLPLIIWLVYGLLMLFEKGIFIVPYPLNPIVFSVIALYFLVRSATKISYWFLLFPIGFTLLQSPVFLEFVLTPEKLFWFQESVLYDFIILFQALSYSAFALLYGIFQTQSINKYLGFLSAIIIIPGVLFAQPLLLLIAYSLQVIINRKTPLFNPFHHLWLLLFGLTLLEVITLFVNHSYPL